MFSGRSRFAGVVLAGVLMSTAWAETAWASGGANAVLKTPDGKDAGKVTFTETPAGVLVSVALAGLPAGQHAISVRETGKCDGDFASSGGVHNPLGAKHGFFNEDGPMAGDMPNVTVASDGTGQAEFLSTFLSIGKDGEDGVFDGDGSAVVVLSGPDDYLSDPDGGAGPAIACGVVVRE